MSLILPTVGQEPGPNWALDLNSSLSLVDQHNHASGSGVQITPAGINIDVDLPFNGSNATGLRSARFDVQGSPLSGGLDIGCIYVSGQDLYYNDTLGNQVQLTASGAVNGTPGSIGNLIAPAAVTYVPANQTFVFESNQTNATPAALDGGPVLIRNVTAASNYIRLQANPVLPGNYSITLPSSLPASQQFMTINSLGNVVSVAADNSTVEISANTLQVKDNGITLAKMADNSVGTLELIDGNVTNSKLGLLSVSTGNIQAAAITEDKKSAGTYISYTVNIPATLVGNSTWQTVGTIGTLTTTQDHRLAMMGFKNAPSSYGISIAVPPGGGWFYRIVVSGPSGYTNYLYLTIKDINGAPATTNLEDQYNWLSFPSSGPLIAWPVNVMQSLTLPSVGAYTFTLQFKGPFSNPQWYNYIGWAQLGS
jgi:hypothetical protein